MIYSWSTPVASNCAWIAYLENSTTSRRMLLQNQIHIIFRGNRFIFIEWTEQQRMIVTRNSILRNFLFYRQDVHKTKIVRRNRNFKKVSYLRDHGSTLFSCFEFLHTRCWSKLGVSKNACTGTYIFHHDYLVKYLILEDRLVDGTYFNFLIVL